MDQYNLYQSRLVSPSASSRVHVTSEICDLCHTDLYVAEHEAEMISTRTKLALAAAKRKNVVLGGDRGNCAQIARKGNKASAKVRTEAAQRRAADLLPVIETIKAEGAQSLRQIAQQLNQRGISASRGGVWSPAQVLRIMEHASACLAITALLN
jgi:hypothetical protein